MIPDNAIELPDNVIVAATQNLHKIKEIDAITSGFGLRIVPRDEAGVPPVEIVEDGLSFEENSYKKAFGIMELCGRPTIADDSGSEVDCLGGAPGIYSARFAAVEGIPEIYRSSCREGISVIGDEPGAGSQPDAGNHTDAGNQPDAGNPISDSDDKDNNCKLMKLLRDVPYEERTGRFVSVITMVFPDDEPIVCRGTVEGHIITEERGEGGFGYDPMFIPDGYDKTFGQLPAELKNSISHRANALKMLARKLQERQQTLTHKHR